MAILVCRDCKREYEENTSAWRCSCGGPFQLSGFSPRFPQKEIQSRPTNLWRYREALPIHKDSEIISLGEGMTPLLPLVWAGREILFKLEFLFPTGSFKDRGSTVMLTKLKELGIRQVVEDSSGNAGASVAAYAARGNLDCGIYVPDSTSPGKILQAEMYGATVVRVPGSREATAAAVQEAAQTTFYASHNWNPYFLEGTKTFAFEIWEQLSWQVPDLVMVPVGNGSLLLGAYYGFLQLLEAGLIPKLPLLVGVQAEGCAPLYQAYRHGLNLPPAINKSETIAEGISIAEPVHGLEILQAIRETGGRIEVVSDLEIWATLQQLAQRGLYVEPTAAAAPAALTALIRKKILPEVSKIIVALTGMGLKATEKLMILREKWASS